MAIYRIIQAESGWHFRLWRINGIPIFVFAICFDGIETRPGNQVTVKEYFFWVAAQNTCERARYKRGMGKMKKPQPCTQQDRGLEVI